MPIFTTEANAKGRIEASSWANSILIARYACLQAFNPGSSVMRQTGGVKSCGEEQHPRRYVFPSNAGTSETRLQLSRYVRLLLFVSRYLAASTLFAPWLLSSPKPRVFFHLGFVRGWSQQPYVPRKIKYHSPWKISKYIALMLSAFIKANWEWCDDDSCECLSVDFHFHANLIISFLHALSMNSLISVSVDCIKW